MTNLSNFSNKNFTRTVRMIRKLLPFGAIALLILVYGVSAIAAGVLLASLMKGLAFGLVLAYGIGISIQGTRAMLVFFPQLNPSRPTLSYVGEVIAVLMGIISVAEIIGLVLHVNLALPVGISLSILMMAGVGIEIFLLKEIRFSSEIEIFSNKEYWQHLKDFHKSRKEYEDFIDNLENEGSSIPTTSGQPAPPQRELPPTPPKKTERVLSNAVLSAIAKYSLNQGQLDLIRGWIDKGMDEQNILKSIEALPKGNEQEKPLELGNLSSPNGHSI